MKLSAEQIRQFDDLGYLFFPNCFSEDEIALMRSEGDAILRLEREEVWREKSGAPRTAFAAHKFNEVFRLLAHHPRLVDAAGADFRREPLRPSVQAQRQGGVRGRRVAMAPGLRHLGARRRHAGAARDEHRGVPRRGVSVQRRADAASRAATSTARCRPATISRRPRIRSGRSTRIPSRGSAARPSATASPASWRRPASPARC